MRLDSRWVRCDLLAELEAETLLEVKTGAQMYVMVVNLQQLCSSQIFMVKAQCLFGIRAQHVEICSRRRPEPKWLM